MKTETIREKSGRLTRGLWIFLFLVTLTSSAFAEIIPANRRIDWSLAGARSDWRTRTTICATLSPSGGNDAPAITNAIAACPQGQVVKLNPGTFKLSSAIVWGNHSNVTLRGSGKTATLLQGQSPFTAGNGNSIFDFWGGRGASPDWDWTLTPTVALSSGLTKDSTRITAAASHGWVAGDYVLIDQLNGATTPPDVCLNNSNWLSRANCTRMRAQIVKVTNVVDTRTVDITPPLYFDYSLAQTPQGKKANIKLEGISVESLKVDNHTSKMSHMFYIYNVFNSLFYDLDLDGIPAFDQSRHFHIYNALWLTISHSDMHGWDGNQTNQGYGFFLGYATSGLLIEDNTMYGVQLGVAFEGATSGNVVAYNFTTGSIWFDPTVNRLMIINHGGGLTNLIEGNIIQGRFRQDSFFGSGHWNTLLRNRIEQIPGTTDQTQVFDIEQIHYNTNAVGNVLGTVGRERVFEQSCVSGASSGVQVIYRLGYTGAYEATGAGCDTQVKATLLRHGNWDSVNQATVWDPAITDHVIPNSYYLSAKPSFFGTCAWPSIGADLSPLVSTLPAKARHDGLSICVVVGSPPQPPTNLAIQ